MDFLIENGEDLFGFLMLVVGGIIALVSASARKKRRAQQNAHQTMPARQSVPTRPMAARSATPARTAPASVLPEREAFRRTEMAPRVATTVRVSEHDHEGMFEGSMAAQTLEGVDLHDHGQKPLHMPSQDSDRILNQSLSEESADEQETAALELGWDDRNSLVKAFVMQEVLTRPCDRRR